MTRNAVVSSLFVVFASAFLLTVFAIYGGVGPWFVEKGSGTSTTRTMTNVSLW